MEIKTLTKDGKTYRVTKPDSHTEIWTEIQSSPSSQPEPVEALSEPAEEKPESPEVGMEVQTQDGPGVITEIKSGWIEVDRDGEVKNYRAKEISW